MVLKTKIYGLRLPIASSSTMATGSCAFGNILFELRLSCGVEFGTEMEKGGYKKYIFDHFKGLEFILGFSR